MLTFHPLALVYFIGGTQCFGTTSRQSRSDCANPRSATDERLAIVVRIVVDLAIFYMIFLCMTRSSSNILYELDPEIDRNLRRLRKVRSSIVSNSSNSNSVANFDNTIFATNDFDFSEYKKFDINPDSNLVVRNFQESE
ncbi:hypothetical protein CR513_28758, partial [Mucuna pruriens]